MAPLEDISLCAACAAVLLLSALAVRQDLGGGLQFKLPALGGGAAILCALLSASGLDWRTALTLTMLLIACCLIAEIDRRSMIIPDLLVVAVALLSLVAPFSPPWDEKLIGAALLGGLFLLVRVAFHLSGKPHALGLGDVKLATAMGAMLGAQDGLTAVAIAGVATLCGMLWRVVRKLPGTAVALSGATTPFGIGLAAALSAVSAFRIWSGA